MKALGLHAALRAISTRRFSLAAALTASTLLLVASSAQALSFSPSCFTDHPGTAAVADFNEDGKPDIALTTEVQVPDGLFLGLDVEVYLGHGDGTFAPAIVLNGVSGGGGILTIIAADANNDGHVDVIAANGGGTISVFEGRGDGTFSSKKNYGAVKGGVTGGRGRGLQRRPASWTSPPSTAATPRSRCCSARAAAVRSNRPCVTTAGSGDAPSPLRT
jgi:hypothetical protein